MAPPAAGEVRFQHAAPQLPTRDLRTTKEWYEQHLGFRSAGPWEAWNFLILEREGVRLHFFPAEAVDGEGGTFYLQVAGDVDALAARLDAAGVDTHGGARDQPYGMREVSVHDPDGRHVIIGKPLEAPR